MKLSDYVVNFLSQHGVVHFFGYQGTNICHFVDSIARNPEVANHSCYNEQGAAFAACGFAQASRQCAVAYATGGPGAVNLLSGMADAYFDSLPAVFLTGQINTGEYDANPLIRQHSFQEIDIVDMASPITKYAVQLTDATRARYELEKAWYTALSGRPGPVLIDLPMDVQRADINPDSLEGFSVPDEYRSTEQELDKAFESAISTAKRPVLLVGNGVSQEAFSLLRVFASHSNIPIITSVLARQLMSADDPLNFGYIGGAYGHREANLIAGAKADLIIAVGISLCSRQIGVGTDDFAPRARLLHIDIEDQTSRRVIKQDAINIKMDSCDAAKILSSVAAPDFADWLSICDEIRSYYRGFDDCTEGREPNQVVSELSSWVPANTCIAVDVGQHMMWVGQSFEIREGQHLLFSGGHGAMGYAIPAAIGAWYYSLKPVYCFVGDGGFQMNSQELEWIARESLPIKIVVLNNKSLGMVRFQQSDLFAGDYEGTALGYHYSVPDFVALAQAYGIDARRITATEEIGDQRMWFEGEGPRLLEVSLPNDSAAYPKTHFGDPIYDQEPRIPSEELERLLAL